ncbi:MAG: polysulfide reductase NrfD, partial [Desulfobulbaceae bacterium]|nr:polysulfide reductase NrfD [Desulfobulbaceae bacterium]
MKTLIATGKTPVARHYSPDKKKLTIKDKLLLGLSLSEYLAQAFRNPVNWIFAIIFTFGGYVTLTRFLFGLGYVTHSSYDYPWGLFLGWGLFVMVPLSASGFMLGTTVEVFGRHDFKPIERLALLNGLLGYLFAVIFLQVDLGQPWRLIYPMFVSLGPAAVLFLVAWHVATYLSVQVAELVPAFAEWAGAPKLKTFIKSIILGL